MSTEQSRIRRAVDSRYSSVAVDALAFAGKIVLLSSAMTLYALFMVVVVEVLDGAGVDMASATGEYLTWVFQIPIWALMGYALALGANALGKRVDMLRTTFAFTAVFTATVVLVESLGGA